MRETRCTTCRLTPAETPFYPSYRSQCKSCLKAKALPKREEKKAYLKQWRALHPSAHKNWYQRNKSGKSTYWREWYQANKQRRSESYAVWAKRNPHIVNALIAKRSAAKRRALPEWADQVAMRAVYAEAARLTKETGVRHDVDHIYPLQSETVCGLHCEANLQILTKIENIRKGNRMPSAA